MSELPLFSILIASYNNGQFLLEAVQSVFDQTYSNWEIIIVDDCSTDNSEEIIDGIITEGVNIKFFKNDVNHGCGYTKNRCCQLAKGEILGFLDPDDTLEKTAIEKMVNKHHELPAYSLIYSQNYLCDSKLQLLNNGINGGPIKKNETQLTSVGNNRITHFASCKVLFYNKTSGINPILKRAIDQDFYYKMEEVGDIYFIEEPLYFYRTHEQNISRNQNSLKAIYWKYVTDKDAYIRRRKNKLSIKNISYGELQRRYLDVCLRKIHEKIFDGQFKNLYYYYYQLLKLMVWDKEFKIMSSHTVILKKIILNILKL
jgi:glycosyltransferase involved in cell wall biosynthesis